VAAVLKLPWRWRFIRYEGLSERTLSTAFYLLQVANKVTCPGGRQSGSTQHVMDTLPFCPIPTPAHPLVFFSLAALIGGAAIVSDFAGQR